MYTVSFTLNGKPVEATVKATTTLLEALRDELRVTSPKMGCDTGDCGNCAVLLDGKLVNSCLVLAATVEGREVTTVEALGTPEKLHPLQEAFHEHYASQCGFCTPGMILAAKALLDENPKPTRDEIKRALAGNLCRCTGYYNIIEAVEAVAEQMATP